MGRILICSSRETGCLDEYMMKCLGAGHFQHAVCFTGERAFELTLEDHPEPFNAAIVDLQFSHGYSPSGGLMAMEQIRKTHPMCRIICVTKTGDLATEYLKQIVACGAETILSLSHCNWRIDLAKALALHLRDERNSIEPAEPLPDLIAIAS